jgi:hypothetical protein
VTILDPRSSILDPRSSILDPRLTNWVRSEDEATVRELTVDNPEQKRRLPAIEKLDPPGTHRRREE